MRCIHTASIIVLVSLALISPATLAQEQPKPKPCSGELHDGFDFWVGEWEVSTADGKVAGHNVITKQNCYLLERWSGAGGSHGMSLNFVNPETGRWTQDWIGGGGGRILIEGELKDGSMVLVGTNTLPDGTQRPFRGSWTLLEDGRVRQFFEESKDDGKSFAPWFEGFYKKKPQTD